MTTYTMSLLCLLLALPCASHALWYEVMGKITPAAHKMMVRNMATLSSAKCTYAQRLEKVEKNFETTKARQADFTRLILTIPLDPLIKDAILFLSEETNAAVLNGMEREIFYLKMKLKQIV